MSLLSRRRRPASEPEVPPGPAPIPATSPDGAVVEIPDHDPFYAYLLEVGAPVDLTTLSLDSPAVAQLREAKVELVVPLINQGELLGTLNLGHRLSDQPYSSDDRRLFESLAAQVAPAIRVAQLVRAQEEEAKERQRIEQELRVASLIQQTLLPKDLPRLPGWEIDAYYRPAREVGGDFYDFIALPQNRLGVIIGDVTDKGVPAALVMATTRASLRAAALRHDVPGRVLADVNEGLHPDIPPGMFVTCFYGILDPIAGELRYANAGHNLPYVRTDEGVVELRATGMPLGLLPDRTYEEKVSYFEGGDSMLLSSDGIAEAHDPRGTMFGLPRLMGLVGAHREGADLLSAVLGELDRHTAGADQEDDVTMVVVRRTSSASASAKAFGSESLSEVASFSIASEEGNEREAMAKVQELAPTFGLPAERLERLKTAVAEATMNAIEHGNLSDPEKSVDLSVLISGDRVVVRVRDQGGGREIPQPVRPDLDAKLAGTQSPRGWGLFLIGQMVDELHTDTSDTHHTVELVMYRQGHQVPAGETGGQ